jgi:alkylation response protein AidB-like acyl-CoA dehydrogenase
VDGERSGEALTSEEVQSEATAWLEANWDPAQSVRAWWAKLAESGWSQPQWPVEWFGRGLPGSAVSGVREAFATVGALGPPTSLGHALGGPTLLTHANEEQKARFLPGLATGEEAWCQFFSEPGSGSDLASAQTRAVRDGDEVAVEMAKAVQPRRANPALLALNAARSSGTFENPVIRQAVTAAWATSEVDRLSKLRSAAAVRAGSPPGSTGSIGKLTRTRINRSAAHAGMAAIGAEGLLVGPDTVLSGAVQELSLSTPSTSIAGGTDEIQRNIVGERVLGLPKEPAVDRDVPFRDLRVGTQPSGRRP